jgi:hypothetical protein
MNPIIQNQTMAPATDARDRLAGAQAIPDHVATVKGHFAAFAVEDEFVGVLRLGLVVACSNRLGDGGAARASG